METCALRAWPGNVRELLHEVRRAAHRALQDDLTVLEPRHLSDEAGLLIVGTAAEALARRPVRAPSDEEIERALGQNGGNVRGTARALGIHRNQLRRWLEKRSGRAETPE